MTLPEPDVVVVDHHDSYTWNLVHLIATVTGVLPTVVQHDEVTADEVLAHRHVVLSPGPGHPADVADFAVGGEGRAYTDAAGNFIPRRRPRPELPLLRASPLFPGDALVDETHAHGAL